MDATAIAIVDVFLEHMDAVGVADCSDCGCNVMKMVLPLKQIHPESIVVASIVDMNVSQIKKQPRKMMIKLWLYWNNLRLLL